MLSLFWSSTKNRTNSDANLCTQVMHLHARFLCLNVFHSFSLLFFGCFFSLLLLSSSFALFFSGAISLIYMLISISFAFFLLNFFFFFAFTTN